MAPKGSKQGPEDRATQTLGDVLDAKTSAGARAAETEWVTLMRSIAARDSLALRALYTRTHRLVFTLAVRIVGNRETAEEVTLDVFHDVWRRAPAYDPGGGSVIGWVMNQAQSRAIDRLRFEQRRKRVPDAAADPVPAATEGPQEALESRERATMLQRALQELSAQERQAIETAFFSELSYSETAARLNEPVGTVKTRIRSGLSKLRQALDGTMFR